MPTMELQNQAPKDHMIYVTLRVTLNYGDAEANYTNEQIKEMLDTAFKCPNCFGWHLNQTVCGMDDIVLADIQDKK